MKYYVTHVVMARLISEVDANSFEEAMAKGDEKFAEADCGEFSDVDGEICVVEDEKGVRLYEK